MRFEKTFDGRKVRVYEAGDGIRRKYRELLGERHFKFPTHYTIRHPKAWYLEEANVCGRPLFGLYSLAQLAEDTLWYAKFGKRVKRRPDFVEACRFYAATRRAMHNVLQTHAMDSRFQTAESEKLRGTVRTILAIARKIFEKPVDKMPPAGV